MPLKSFFGDTFIVLGYLYINNKGIPSFICCSLYVSIKFFWFCCSWQILQFVPTIKDNWSIPSFFIVSRNRRYDGSCWRAMGTCYRCWHNVLPIPNHSDRYIFRLRFVLSSRSLWQMRNGGTYIHLFFPMI
jgi:hypothetical protein